MNRFAYLIATATLTSPLITVAAGPSQPAAASEPTKATYLITGLHCRPCTTTVETSLRGTEGVHSVSVDWNTKNARIEFDESKLPAQKLAQAIASTPHMMGSSMHYAGWLALSVPDVKDDASGKLATDALARVKGVKNSMAYPKQHSVAVQFAPQGEATSRELIDALAAAGMKASNY